MASSVSGMASTAPTTPSSHPHSTSATNVSDTDRPSASPTYLGWTTEVSTKLTTVNSTNTTAASEGPPISSASSSGGTSAIQKPR